MYHVLNRAVARLALFEKEADYDTELRTRWRTTKQVLVKRYDESHWQPFFPADSPLNGWIVDFTILLVGSAESL